MNAFVWTECHADYIALGNLITVLAKVDQKWFDICMLLYNMVFGIWGCGWYPIPECRCDEQSDFYRRLSQTQIEFSSERDSHLR